MQVVNLVTWEPLVILYPGRFASKGAAVDVNLGVPKI